MSIARTITGSMQAARIAAALIPVVRAGEGDGAVRARRHLADVLGRQRGLPTKVGQWLAGGEHGDDFAVCTEALPPVPWARMRAALAAAWGFPVESVLAQVDEHGHAASLGQVHRARLADGREVAVKVQYPEIRASVESTLAALGLVPGLGPVRRHGMDLDGHRDVLRATVELELDYRIEAAAQRRAADLAGPGVIVPRIHGELTRETVLVQDWEDGTAIDAAAGWDQARRDGAGAALVRRFLRQALVEGLLHGDPHPGNFRFRATADGVAIVQYDHGCMVGIPPALAANLRALAIGARSGTGDPLARLAAAGFAADKLAPIAARLPRVLAILLHPLVVPGPCAAAGWHPAAELTAELGADRWWFRAAGTPELFLLTRAFGGLVRQLQRLDATVDWAACWAEALGEALPEPAVRTDA